MPAAISGDEFVARARAKHGAQYLYDPAKYVRSSAKIQIVCRIHGEFEMTPNAHLNGQGCKRCGAIRRARIYSGGLTRFMEKASSVHGGRFDYRKSRYQGVHVKLEIVCKEHGSFLMTPDAHVNGRQKCPQCYDGFKKPTHVYVLRAGELSKVGIATDLDVRLGRMAKHTPFEFEFYCSYLIDDYVKARAIEKEAHALLRSSRASLSKFDGHTEWFECSAANASVAVSSALIDRSLDPRSVIRF